MHSFAEGVGGKIMLSPAIITAHLRENVLCIKGAFNPAKRSILKYGKIKMNGPANQKQTRSIHEFSVSTEII